MEAMVKDKNKDDKEALYSEGFKSDDDFEVTVHNGISVALYEQIIRSSILEVHCTK